ncbi:hypothetical protein [Adlercreutzia sp. ZJ141]|uniref:hypothetical protein n=1 Tax=Adlercreutzia sp. ZJ141 TaxID=2709406 RepID=UPI0013EA3808|nr:hypothetical protein [Adlercreutzia sp. ZJ141]
MDNPIVKYTKSQYTAKISELEGCIGRLDTHLETLESLKNKVTSFWDDPQTPDYLRQLTVAIVSVRNARDRTQKLLAEYNGMVEEMSGVTAMTTGIIDDIGGIIGSLGIKE